MFDNYYAKYYEILNQNKPYKKEIEFVHQWAGKPNWIFDIGCGTASYWKYYPKDTQILGVEKSLAMAQLGKPKQIICADITEYKHFGRFDCATALFDVINYIPKHDWWGNIPIDSGGIFIFDIFDKEKVDKEGFRETFKRIGNISRRITLCKYDGKTVDLAIKVWNDGRVSTEMHRMYVYSRADIEKFCGQEFEIVEIKTTESWQTWYKLKRR